MNPIRYAYILLFTLCITIVACGDDPVVPNEEELITTLIYTLTPVGGGNPVVFSFRDPDGEGGQAPVVILGKLAPNTVYNTVIQLLNESVAPVNDITLEVQDEALDHQFFYTFSDVNVSYAYKDMDTNSHPIGINTQVTAGDPGEGLLTVILRHKPDKAASGVSDGDTTNAGGETDIEVSFLLIIE